MKPTSIASLRNPLIKDVRKALSRGALTDEGLVVAETFHLLEDALRSGLDIPAVIAAERVLGVVARHIEKLRNTRLYSLPDPLLSELATTETSQGVLALIRPPVWKLDNIFRGKPLILVLDGLQDPGNLGAIFRAAEAFGVTGVLLMKGTTSTWNSKSVRASAGSVFRLPFLDAMEPDVVRAALSQRKLDVWCAQPRGGRSLNSIGLNRRTAIIIGNEARGISPAMLGAGEDFHIPTTGVESLNASIAAGIVLYEAWRQRATHEPV
jgi:TrmH family RNA methyltransferase